MPNFNKFLLIALIFLISGQLYANDVAGRVRGQYNKDVTDMMFDKNNILFVATWGGGIFKSADEAVNFTEANNGITNKYIYDLFIGINGNLYITTYGGGIFTSTNAGNSWTAINTDLPTLNVKAITQNSNGDLYCGTYGYGVFKSTNAGASWTAANGYGVPFSTQNDAIFNMDINCMGVALDSGFVFVGTYGHGIFRTTDNGNTWKRANSGMSSKFINSISYNPNTKTVLATTNGKGLYESPTGGEMWISYTDLNPSALKDNNVISVAWPNAKMQNGLKVEPIVGTRDAGLWYYDRYAYEDWVHSESVKMGSIPCMTLNSKQETFAYVTGRGIYKTTNHGKNWIMINGFDNFFYANNFQYFVLAGEGDRFFAQAKGQDLEYTDDYGITFNKVSGVSGPIRGGDRRGSKIVMVSPGNIFYSANNGVNWTSNATPQTIIQDVAMAPNGDLYIIGQVPPPMPPPEPIPQDIKILKSTNQGATWTLLTTVSGSSAVIHCFDNNTLYAGIEGHNTKNVLFRSFNAGSTWTLGLYSSDLYKINDIKTNSQGHVYFSTAEGLYTSTDQGVTHTKSQLGIKLDPNNSFIGPDANKIEIINDQQIWVGMNSNMGVFRTYDAGAKWSNINNSILTAPIMDMTKNDESDLFFTTNSLWKVINPEKMGVPNITLPANNSKGLSLNPRIEWTTSEKAELYHLQVSVHDDFSAQTEDVILAPNQRDVFVKLQYNMKYYTRVRGKTFGSYSNWSNVTTFTTMLAPPNLVSPIDKKRGVAQFARLVWDTSATASHYEVQVAKDKNFADIVFTKDNIKDTTITTSELLPITTYYWRAKAKSAGSESPWSVVWEFRTVLGKPKLIYPSNNSEKIPTEITFLWESVEEADDYWIQISFKSDMSESLFESKTLNVNNQLYDNLTFNRTYYWRVYSINEDGTSQWSDTWKFETGLGAPDLISPVNKSIGQNTQPNFTWKKNKDAKSYQIEIAKDVHFNEIIKAEEVDSESYLLSEEMSRFTTLYWRVASKIDSDVSNWSETWSFRTKMGLTNLTGPADETQGVNNKVLNYYWEKTAGADSYDFALSENINMTNPVKEAKNLTLNEFTTDKMDFDKQYFWQVTARNKDNEESKSPIWRFRTKQDTLSIAETIEVNSYAVYPNPFDTYITVSFKLKQASNIRVEVLDAKGNDVALLTNSFFDYGQKEFTWYPSNISSGKYFIRISVGNESLIRDVILNR